MLTTTPARTMLALRPLLVIALAGVFLIATIRPGHDWGCDFSLYIAHARNLVEGRPYAATGYIYNPHVPSLSPRTYPPGLPLLLAPVYALFGLNLTAMKIELIAVFLLFLAVFTYCTCRGLPERLRLLALTLVAFSPVFWQYKDRILSEFPFMLFVVSAHACLNWAYSPDIRRGQWWLATIVAGLFVLASCLTRSVGVVLVPTVLAYDLLRYRRPGPIGLVVLTVFALGIGVQRTLLPPDGSYLDQVGFNVRQFLDNQEGFAWATLRFFDNGYLSWASKQLTLALLGLMLAGYVRCCRERFTPAEIFVVLYTLAICLWPSSGGSNRFLFPLVPFGAAYACWGWDWLASRLGKVRVPAGVALAALLLVSQISLYTSFDFGPIREGVETAEAQALFAHLRETSTPNDVAIFYRPRALALYTGTSASIHHRPDTDAEMWQYLNQIGATRLVLARSFGDSYRYLKEFADRHAREFEPDYRSDQFEVFRIRGGTMQASR
jgi:hypothetical protein